MGKIKKNDTKKTFIFNSAVEIGIRLVSVLEAAYPKTFDLRWLILFDYLLVHTHDINGPENLHPSTRMYKAELIVRRKMVEQALILMMTRGLVERVVEPDGIKYKAGENAVFFVSSMSSYYSQSLKERASWVVKNFCHYKEEQFEDFTRSFFNEWLKEYHFIECKK